MPTWKKLLDTPASEGGKALFSVLSGAPGTAEMFASPDSLPDFDNLFSMHASLGAAATAFPTYTNPNNVCIVTGQPPSVTGISGNYYYDEASGKEVPMNDPSLIRCDSVLAALQQQGCGVTVVTAKDKLSRLLAHQLQLSGHAQTSVCSRSHFITVSISYDKAPH
jgi:phosphonoacetate hydrolase